MTHRSTALVLSACLAGALPLAAAGAAHAAPLDEPFVAEIHYDDAGADTGELVEIQLPPGTTSEGWSVVRYNGSGGAPYGTDVLPAVTAPGDADAVAVLEYPVNGLQNGAPDALALVRPDGSVAEFLSYEGAFTAVGGPGDGQSSTDIGVAENGEPEGQSLSRVLVDGDLVWQGPSPATPGALNAPPSAPPAGTGASCEVAPADLVGQVQGNGAATALEGETVSVRGTVVGDTAGLGGFYLQDGGDGDDATSDGIFVPSAADIALGDTVAVAGTAGEGFGQTQITPVGDVAVCAAGTLPQPAALELPSADAERERTEGMLVAPSAALSVSEVFALTRFGELTLSAGGVLVQPTEASRPGPGADAVAADNALRRIVLDDASTERLDVTSAPYLSPTSPVRVGDAATLSEPVVLGYGFGSWRLQPADGTADGVLAPQNTRPAAPREVGGDVQVASFNVLNYFLTFADPPGRGASDQGGLDAQSAKIVAAIRGLDADVITLEEVEDTDSSGLTPGNADTAVADLVSRLNAAQGSEAWAFAPFPTALYDVPRDVIRNAIIYRTDAVVPVGASVADVDEDVWFNAREPIAQTFAPAGPDGAALAGGDTFTVVGNHFKSKGGSGATGDNDPANTSGQAAYNGDRVRQAQSLAAFVEGLKTSTGDPDVLVLGDLNAYTQEDPVQTLRDAGLTDLGSAKDAGKYSYVFDALSGSLDHALGTDSLTKKVTGVDTWLINAQESFAYQYDGDPALYAPNPHRASDHNPLVLGLALDAPVPPTPPQPTCKREVATIVGTDGKDVLRGTEGRDVIVGRGADDVIDARGGDDLVCGGPGNDVVQAGYGDDRVYGQSGRDVINGGPGSDRISGGAGKDVMAGGGGSDFLDGKPRQYLIE